MKKLTVKKNNKIISYIDYYINKNNNIKIYYIETDLGYIRKGYGTKAIKKLYRKYPDKKIIWGELSYEGRKLKNSLIKRG